MIFELATVLVVILVTIDWMIQSRLEMTKLKLDLENRLLNELKDGMEIARKERKQSLDKVTDIIKAAMEGNYVVVTKPPVGMTLEEAQAHIDEVLAPLYPPPGKMKRSMVKA